MYIVENSGLRDNIYIAIYFPIHVCDAYCIVLMFAFFLCSCSRPSTVMVLLRSRILFPRGATDVAVTFAYLCITKWKLQRKWSNWFGCYICILVHKEVEITKNKARRVSRWHSRQHNMIKVEREDQDQGLGIYSFNVASIHTLLHEMCFILNHSTMPSNIWQHL